MQRLEHAVNALEEVLVGPPHLQHLWQHPWRHLVRDRLTTVHEALAAEQPAASESWLDARVGRVSRERDRLLALIGVFRSTVVDAADVQVLQHSLLDLVQDLHRYHQRINDLAYDAVAMEVGGSE